MQTLDNFHSRKTAPVYRIDVPDTDGTHNTADTISKQSDRDGTEDDCDWAEGQVVEDVRRSEDLATRGSDGR